MGIFDGSSMCMEQDRDDTDEDYGKVVSLGCSIVLQEGQWSPVFVFGRAPVRCSFRQDLRGTLSCCFLILSTLVVFLSPFFFISFLWMLALPIVYYHLNKLGEEGDLSA